MNMLDPNYERGFDDGIRNTRKVLIKLREPYLRLIARGNYIDQSNIGKLNLLAELIDYTSELLEVVEDEI